MQCISIKQPFAQLIVAGFKTIECRSWPTSYRGPLLIHASKNFAVSDQAEAGFRILRGVGISQHMLVRGAIIGQTTLMQSLSAGLASHAIGPHDELVGIFVSGWYSWILSDPFEYDQPIRATGQLGLWTPSAAIQKKVALARTV